MKDRGYGAAEEKYSYGATDFQCLALSSVALEIGEYAFLLDMFFSLAILDTTPLCSLLDCFIDY